MLEHIGIEAIVDDENGGQIIEETTIRKTKTLQSGIYPGSIGDWDVKYLIPREPGHGATGLFCEGSTSLNITIPPFSFVALNLKPENERPFLTAISTLTFNPISNNN